MQNAFFFTVGLPFSFLETVRPGYKLESAQAQFLSSFLPHFSVLQNGIHELTKFSCFADFFVRIIKTKLKNGFI